MKLLNFNIVSLSFFLILGIIAQYHFELDLQVLLAIFVLALIPFVVLSVTKSPPVSTQRLFSILVGILFFAFGSILLALKFPKNQQRHYVHKMSGEGTELVLSIEKRLKPGRYNDKYFARVLRYNRLEVSGRILLHLAKDSLREHLPVDAILISKSPLNPIAKPLNPHQFNYAAYLKNHQVIHQVYLNQENYIVLRSAPYSFYGYADLLRTKINNALRASGLNATSIQMINALLLGQKQDIDPDIYTNFINAGTVHILAVSGLHVGIILLILTWLLKPLLRLKHGRLIRSATIVSFLWLFALTAGLSPSVTRAVTMFSIISVAMHLKRETNIYNTLATSAFLLLMINPSFLFEVGFQLSYAAVLSIVMFQPLIAGLWHPSGLINYIWQIFSVTLAAQLGVAPLSLFYFHQFPGLFFISNLVVVPFLGLILGFGLMVIVLSLIDSLPGFLLLGFEWVIETLNHFIGRVAQFENFLLKDIPFHRLEIVLSYCIILALFFFLNSKKYKWAFRALLCIIFFQCYQTFERVKVPSDQLIVFNKSRYGIIGEQKKGVLLIRENQKDSAIAKHKFLNNYVVNEGIKYWRTAEFQSVYKFNDLTILVIDRPEVYKNLSFKPDIVIFQHSPKVNLNRLLKDLNPSVVVADASNYRSYVSRWKETCLKRNTSFHYTAEDGAFILSN